MAELQSLIPGDEEPDGDAMLLTQLANGLVSRIPTLCTLKTFYDGKEQVPVKSIPKSTNQSGYAVYQRFVSICQLDLAKAIADAVIHRQRPTGFRLIADKTMRSTKADDMWSQCRMELKSRQMFHDLAVYGNAYALVNKNKLPSHITVLSPWDTYVSSDEDSAVNYWYKASEGCEYLALYRLIRNDDGSVKDVYCRIAYNETDSRSLLEEGDEEEIYGIANDDSKIHPTLSPTFQWDGGAESSYDFAEKCECLPIVRMHAPGGKGQFEPHIPTLGSIDQQRFQRFCIQELQAFKQRAVSMSNMPQFYKESDPQVRDGLAQAGDRIDYKDLFQQGPDALWLVPNDGFTRLMRMALEADGNSAAGERFETVWKPINPPSQLEQAQAANYSKGILPVKTNMRRSYGMTEIEIAEAMQDLMDTQFAQAMASENAMIEGKTSQQSAGVLPDETDSLAFTDTTSENDVVQADEPPTVDGE